MSANLSRIGTRANLQQGGTFDLLVMGFANGFPRGYVSFEMGDTPRRVTGVQKVVQTFLKTLLSNRGSDPVHADFGTDLSNYISFSNVGSDEDELNRVIIDCVQDAEQQTQSILNTKLQDLSSQLDSVSILFATTAEETLNIGLKIITKDGSSASVAIPFPQSDLSLNA